MFWGEFRQFSLERLLRFLTSTTRVKGMWVASASRFKALNSSGRGRVEKHHNGEMEPPSALETTIVRREYHAALPASRPRLVGL
jgi:hypothetical protein